MPRPCIYDRDTVGVLVHGFRVSALPCVRKSVGATGTRHLHPLLGDIGRDDRFENVVDATLVW